MNVLAKRRAAGAVCGRCKSPGYDTSPPNDGCNRPSFKCTSCGHFWTYGKDGGVYAELSLPSNASDHRYDQETSHGK